MTAKTALLAAGLALAALGLQGCSDAKKTLGLGKRSPDEFTVTTRAPLTVPPEFALRPPQPGIQRPQELNPTEAARQSIFSASGQAGAQSTAAASAPPIGPVVTSAPRAAVASTGSAASPPTQPRGPATQLAARPGPAAVGGGPSPGEAALMARAGADKATPNIRTIVNEETTRLAEADRPFVDKLIFWKEPLEAQSDVVNPAKETQRLQDNAALGKPPSEGEVPIIKRRQPSLFDRLF